MILAMPGAPAPVSSYQPLTIGPVRTLIDLFAGCGGMTSGFVAEDFEPLLAVEFDLHAAATYAANFGEDHTIWRDIASVRSREIPKAQVVRHAKGSRTLVPRMSTIHGTSCGASTCVSFARLTRKCSSSRTSTAS